MFTNKKRISLVAGTVAVVLAGAGVAVAYWTTTGTGTGTGTTGTNTALTIAQNSTPTGLVPGGVAQAVDFTVTNPAPSDVQVTAVVITVTSTSNAGCYRGRLRDRPAGEAVGRRAGAHHRKHL